jgi:hypothetical protein
MPCTPFRCHEAEVTLQFLTIESQINLERKPEDLQN